MSAGIYVYASDSEFKELMDLKLACMNEAGGTEKCDNQGDPGQSSSSQPPPDSKRAKLAPGPGSESQ